MAKKPKSKLESVAENHKHLEIEDGLALAQTPGQAIPQALENVLVSPYEPGSMEDKVFNLAKEAHSTIPEIALILGESEKYIEEEFKDVLERGWTACKILLRRQQLRTAQEGDSKQLTWLGKQILGQEDKATLDIPLTIIVDTGIKRT